MSFELREKSFVLFRRRKQQTGDRGPDWTGRTLIEGREMEVALWEKAGAKGTYYSGTISEPRARAPRPESAEDAPPPPRSKPQPQPARTSRASNDDDVPF